MGLEKHTPIDVELDRADHDAVQAFIDGTSERRLWIVYQALHNGRGLRMERAQHEIGRLAPRKAAA